MTKKSQATGEARHPIPALDARLRAIVADLIFLADFLQHSVDIRSHTPLDSHVSDLARTAVQQGAHLLTLGEALQPQYPPRPEAIATAETLEQLIGCRETALWLLPTPEDDQAFRNITAFLLRGARIVHGAEFADSESAVRRDLHAATIDLQHLKQFVLETFELVGEGLARQLLELSEQLEGAVRGLVGVEEGAG